MGMYNFSQKFSVIGEIFSENLSGIKFLDSLCSVFTPMMHYWISWTSRDWSRKHQRNQIRQMYRIASRTWLIGLHGNCYHSTVPNVARCRISVFIDFCLRHVCCFNMLLDIIYRKQMLSKSELQHCIFSCIPVIPVITYTSKSRHFFQHRNNSSSNNNNKVQQPLLEVAPTALA